MILEIFPIFLEHFNSNSIVTRLTLFKAIINIKMLYSEQDLFGCFEIRLRECKSSSKVTENIKLISLRNFNI